MRRVGPRTAVVGAGAAAGLVAGGAMALFVMLVLAWRGFGFLTPLRAFAGVLLRHGALDAGWGAVLLGLVVHGATSAVLGVALTALVLRRTDPVASVPVGLFAATVAWAILIYGVTPLADPTLRELAGRTPLAWFGGHVVYGIVVSVSHQWFDVLVHGASPEALVSAAHSATPRDGGAPPRRGSATPAEGRLARASRWLAGAAALVLVGAGALEVARRRR